MKSPNTILEIAYQDDTTPTHEDVFRAFEMVKPEDVKVVIIGQDPYPTPGDADGLSFSTRATKVPRSLQNMFKVIKEDFDIENSSPDLTNWAKQGRLRNNRVSHKQHRFDIQPSVTTQCESRKRTIYEIPHIQTNQ